MTKQLNFKIFWFDFEKQTELTWTKCMNHSRNMLTFAQPTQTILSDVASDWDLII